MNNAIQTHPLTPEIIEKRSKLYETAAQCIKVGAKMLGLNYCKIKDHIFYWKFETNGYLAIDTQNKKMFATSDLLRQKTGTFAVGVEEMVDITTTLLAIIDRSIYAPNAQIVDERFLYIKYSLLSRVERMLTLGKEKLNLYNSHIVGDKLFIYRPGRSYLVFWPAGLNQDEYYLYTCKDLNPDNMVAAPNTYAFLRTYRNLFSKWLATVE